jgi:hypothetical protein
LANDKNPSGIGAADEGIGAADEGIDSSSTEPMIDAIVCLFSLFVKKMVFRDKVMSCTVGVKVMGLLFLVPS